jgi:hypothetical protein
VRTFLLYAIIVLFAPLALAASPAYDPIPWLADLDQARDAMATKYANLEWAVFEREADLPALFAAAKKRIEVASNADEAKAAFDTLARRIGDGHVQFKWTAVKSGSAQETPVADCTALGYDARMAGAPMLTMAPGYAPLKDAPAWEFPSGIMQAGGRRVGVLKIGVFTPKGYPPLCAAALTALNIAAETKCDDACSERVEDWASSRLTEDLAAQLRALQAAGAEVLLVDITSNGGGSEWAEAAVRMVTGIPLKSARMGFVRGEHWVQSFTKHEAELRTAAAETGGEDRALLTGLADEVAARRREAESPCDSAPLWRGEKPACAWVGLGSYAAGLVAVPDVARLKDKPWAQMVFEPVKFHYEAGVWRGPLIVLIDFNTWSAAEEFAAGLQDNHAAVLIGAPSGGAGCGHTDGGTPTLLKNSGGVLDLPDCVRFRADGSNEVMGVQPDILVGLRREDGPHRRAARVAAKLEEAVVSATASGK